MPQRRRLDTRWSLVKASVVYYNKIVLKQYYLLSTQGG
jgi:hypothetical protein